MGADTTTLLTNLNTVDDFLDTEIAAIKAKTDNLPADPADASDVAAAITAAQAAILAVLGALADATAADDPTNTDTAMAYLKQIVNILVGSTGVATFPAAAAAGNGVSLAEVIRQIAASGSIAGAGALTRTIRIRDSSLNPVEGASVWVSTDSAGASVVAGSLTTTSMGVVTVLLDAGTYYVWAQKDGRSPILGTAITVS